MNSHINVGSGVEITIKKLAESIKEVVGYKGQINFDLKKLEGSPRKLVDNQRLNSLGWKAKIKLKEGLTKTYNDFIINKCLV